MSSSFRSPRSSSRRSASSSSSRRQSRPCTFQTSTQRSTSNRPRPPFGTRSKLSAPGGPKSGVARQEARRPGTRGPLVGRATSLLGAPRGVAFLALCAGLGAYYAVHASLPDTSTWGDVAILGLLLMPAVFGLVYLVLPLHRAKP